VLEVMHKGKVGILIVILLSVLVCLNICIYFCFLKPIKIEKINYQIEDRNIYATIVFKNSILPIICSNHEVEQKAANNQCTFQVANEPTKVKIKTYFNEIDYVMEPNIDQIIDFTTNIDNAYLAIGGSIEITMTAEKLGNPSEEIKLTTNETDIVAVNENKITGLKSGQATVFVTVGDITKKITITVTDLITVPTLISNKPKLPCQMYNEEQNKLLDQILLDRIEKSGYQTRAGVVSALRFLTLEFPYRISYFFENGRLNNNTGGHYVDGEGRYYHKGLYLNSYKFNELVKTRFGPSIWGCPLTNWQEEAGFVPGVRYPNGLDCSGFITWAMLNGGYDVGDTGAGDNPWSDEDLSDLGERVPITWDVLTNGSLKAGDIIATDGHIAMIGGIKDNIVYVAESTTYYYGAVMQPYTLEELLQTDKLTYVIYMDHYYKQNGNYTAYWE